MLVPLKWLAEFVDHGLSAEELADALTMTGLEVEKVVPRYQGIAKVVTCRVTAVEPHPKADKLVKARVETDAGDASVVCGAPNCRPGLISAWAQPGALLADGSKVKKASIRGVESRGMLVSQREVGISDDHSGVIELPPDTALGLTLDEALNLETEVLEISVTPNRGDALSMIGVAREVAAITDRPLTLPRISLAEVDPPIEGQAEVIIEAPDDCPRYVARLVKAVEIAPSPIWMCDRLSACGVRPISNVVDVTNYVLLEVGQPLHAFDYHRLAEHRIVVRHAAQGDRFTTLDGQERKLGQNMLMICDGRRQVAVAGVMGGLNSEIFEDTRDVLIEAAFFNPLSIQRTSRRLGLSTEASFRFERGIDRQGCAWAADRAAQLMALLAGGSVARGLIDAYPRPYQAPELKLSAGRTSRFLGLALTREQVAGTLRRLQLEVSEGPDPDTMLVRPPAARTDLERPVDLMEEVARLVGYDRIPPKAPTGSVSARPRPWLQQVRARARDLMAAQGLDEAINYAFDQAASPDLLQLDAADPRRKQVKLLNPLSEEQAVLRTSLLPGLLTSVARNLAHRVADVGLFEVGRVFWDQGPGQQPEEPMRLAGVLCGLLQPASWWAGEGRAGFAHARGAVEYLLEGLGLTQVAFDPDDPPAYGDPEAFCRVLAGGDLLGEVGRLAAPAARAFDLDAPVYFFDLDFDLMAQKSPRQGSFTPLPRYPAVTRDLAMVVAANVPAGEVLDAARGAQTPWLESVELFDVYRGKPLDKGSKSLGLRFCYRSGERTLVEEEVLEGHQALVSDLLQKFGGTLRSRA